MVCNVFVNIGNRLVFECKVTSKAFPRFGHCKSKLNLEYNLHVEISRTIHQYDLNTSFGEKEVRI